MPVEERDLLRLISIADRLLGRDSKLWFANSSASLTCSRTNSHIGIGSYPRSQYRPCRSRGYLTILGTLVAGELVVGQNAHL